MSDLVGRLRECRDELCAQGFDVEADLLSEALGALATYERLFPDPGMLPNPASVALNAMETDDTWAALGGQRYDSRVLRDVLVALYCPLVCDGPTRVSGEPNEWHKKCTGHAAQTLQHMAYVGGQIHEKGDADEHMG